MHNVPSDVLASKVTIYSVLIDRVCLPVHNKTTLSIAVLWIADVLSYVACPQTVQDVPSVVLASKVTRHSVLIKTRLPT